MWTRILFAMSDTTSWECDPIYYKYKCFEAFFSSLSSFFIIRKKKKNRFEVFIVPTESYFLSIQEWYIISHHVSSHYYLIFYITIFSVIERFYRIISNSIKTFVSVKVIWNRQACIRYAYWKEISNRQTYAGMIYIIKHKALIWYILLNTFLMHNNSYVIFLIYIYK